MKSWTQKVSLVLLLAGALVTALSAHGQTNEFWCSTICTSSTSCDQACTTVENGILVLTDCGEYGTCQSSQSLATSLELEEVSTDPPIDLEQDLLATPQCTTVEDCVGVCPGDVRCDAGGCLCLDDPV